MGELTIQKITKDINVDDFCIDNGLIKQNIKDAYFNQVKNISCTQSINLNEKTIGFFEIKALNINDPYDSYCQDNYFVVLLNFIYIEPNQRHKGYGTKVINQIIKQTKQFCDFIGIRFLIINALNEYKNWYENRGFEVIKKNEICSAMCFDFRDNEEYKAYLE